MRALVLCALIVLGAAVLGERMLDRMPFPTGRSDGVPGDSLLVAFAP